MFPDEPTDEERKEELAEDFDTPFRPADDVPGSGTVDDTHPNTDTNVDPDEQYQEGVREAAEAPEPVDNERDLEDVSEISTEETDDDSVGSPS